jgi:hypothetical protein
MFRYSKELLFKEFDAAKEKDVALSKKETREEKELDVYKNRIQFFYDHIELKKKHPEYYELVDIKFDKLLALYETPNPRDAFYMAFFGMTYAQKKRQEDAEYFNLSDDDDNQKTKTRNIEEATL